jgi:hypothetical protein
MSAFFALIPGEGPLHESELQEASPSPLVTPPLSIARPSGPAFGGPNGRLRRA